MISDSTHLSRYPGWDDPARRDELLLHLFDRFDCLIARACARHAVQAADAEDISQKLWENLRPKFDEFLTRYRQPDQPASFRGWLATCARHLVSDLFRDRQKAGRELPADLTATELTESIVTEFDECQIADGCLRQAVRETRERVLPHNWKAFVACVLDGRSPTDVAVDQERSANAVKAGVRRAREMLDQRYRACLARENPE